MLWSYKLSFLSKGSGEAGGSRNVRALPVARDFVSAIRPDPCARSDDAGVSPGLTTPPQPASAAAGEVLVVAHAASAPPSDALRMGEAVCADDHLVGGVFAHCFAEPDWRLSIISGINRLRCRLRRNDKGDQGIFVRAVTVLLFGGYRPLRLMEDRDFSRRVKQRGRSVVLLVPVETSERHVLARGPWRTVAFIVWLLLRSTERLDTERVSTAGAARPIA
jgi:hypothetical protein